MSVSIPPRKGSRAALADELLALMPNLRRRFEGLIPDELRAEMREITTHQLEAAGHLCKTGPMTMHDLAHQQSCAMSTASAMADRLVRAGLAERVADPEDRRVVRLQATERTRELFQRFHAAKRQAAMEATAALSVEEAQTLLALLRKVAGGTPEASNG